MDAKAFAERCEDDRHHFRFIISPEDASRLTDLRTFTRDLMAQAERDLQTELDWVAVDHWNTDNPHIHVLVRGRDEDGRDLVISRAYISQGLRERGAELVTAELGLRTAHEIQAGRERDVTAERWTELDRALAGEGQRNGVIDLRPDSVQPQDDMRRLLRGRVQALRRWGLCDEIAPGRWQMRDDAEQTLRALAARGDLIKTLNRAMHGELDATRLVLHAAGEERPVLGRLVERGLDDELKGSAYAIVDGVDGYLHHVPFPDIDLTGDTMSGAIVELRRWAGPDGQVRTALAVRSDFALDRQIRAPGATWLDRQLLRTQPLSESGFGGAVRRAMLERTAILVDRGFAHRHDDRVIFKPRMLEILRARELGQETERLARDSGLPHQPAAAGDVVSGVFRRRVDLSSGRFAMLESSLGFQLVPWRPSLDPHIGRNISGVMQPDGRVSWSLSRARGLGI